jgi:hypothetical protein
MRSVSELPPSATDVPPRTARSADTSTSIPTPIVMVSGDRDVATWNSATGSSATTQRPHRANGDRRIATNTSARYALTFARRAKRTSPFVPTPNARPTSIAAACGRYETGEYQPKAEKSKKRSSALQPALALLLVSAFSSNVPPFRRM